MKKILFVFAVLISCSGLIFSQTADEIISKYLKNSGGLEKWKDLKSLKMTGSIPTPQGDLDFSMLKKAPDKMLMEINFQGMRIVPQAFDGETAWTINPMSGPEPQKLPEEMTRSVKKDAVFEDPFIDYSDKGHTVEYLGKETVNGTEYYKVKLVKNKNNEQETSEDIYYFDTEFYMPVIVKSQVNGNEVETWFGNYTDIQGFMFPKSIDIKMPGQPEQSIVIDTIEINPELQDDLFTFKE